MSAKSDEGVEICIISEERKSHKLVRWNQEKNCNLNILLSKPNQFYFALHEKFIIIDKKLVVFGTFNLSDVSLNQNVEMYFESDNQRILKEVLKQFNFIKQVTEKNNQAYTPYHYAINKKSQYNFEKDNSKILFSNNYNMLDILSSLVLNAKFNITIFASHSISKEIFSLLNRVDKNQVTMNIFVDYSALKNSDFSLRFYKSIRYIKTKGKMHIKAILIDDDKYLVGSLNLFKRSLYKDQEYILIGNEGKLNEDIRAALKVVSESSSNLSLKDYILIQLRQTKKLLSKIKRRLPTI